MVLRHRWMEPMTRSMQQRAIDREEMEELAMQNDRRRFGSVILSALLLLFLPLVGCGKETASEAQEEGRQEGQTEFISAGAGNTGTRDQPIAEEGGEDAGSDSAEREIEEADLIRIEGDTLYALNAFRGLFVIDIADPDDPVIVGRAQILGAPVEMYFREGFAYVIVSDYVAYGDPEILVETADFSPFEGSEIAIVDLTDPAHPEVVGRRDVEGYISDSRIVGDELYVVTNTWGCPDCTDIAGELLDDGAPYTAVLSYDLSEPGALAPVDTLEFPGNAFQIHVTPEAIFVAATDWAEESVETLVSYVDISDPNGTIALRDTISVPGYVTDRFKLDAYEGTFRIVTHRWEEGGLSTLYVIDVGNPDEIRLLSEVTVGEGDQLFATRFDGPRAYIVTYFQVDPLYVIDLSDPAAPVVAGELEVPGWSVHIEPRGERLIALGIDDTEGRRVSVSLFDVADPAAPSLLSRVSLGEGYSDSSALNDVKAFRVIDEMGLILLPYSAYSFEGEEEGEKSYTNGLQLIDFTADRLEARGYIEQIGVVERAFPHKERLISLSAEELLVIDASDRDRPVVTGTLELMRNVEDFVVVGRFGVQITTRLEREGGTGGLLRCVGLDDPDLGVAIGEAGIDTVANRVFTNGSLLYVVGHLPGTWEVQVNVVDLSDPAEPFVRGEFLLPGDVQLGYGYNYWYGTGDDVVQIDGHFLAFRSGQGSYGGEPVEGEESVPGSEGGGGETGAEPDEGRQVEDDGDSQRANAHVYLLDLSNPDRPEPFRTVEIPEKTALFGLQASDHLLFFTTAEWVGTDEQDRPLVRYFLNRLDLSDPEAPRLMAPVNIPGHAISISRDGRTLYTLDYRWEGEGYATISSLNALHLEEARAVLLGFLDFSEPVGHVEVAGGYAYLSTTSIPDSVCEGGVAVEGEPTEAVARQEDGCSSKLHLRTVALGNPERLEETALISIEGWGSLVAVEEGRLFLSLGRPGGLLVYDASKSPADPRFLGFFRTQGWVSHIVVHEGRAYLPSGLYGVQILDL